MKLTDKQLWVYIGIIVLMPIMMCVFTGLVLMKGNFVELFHSINAELFLIWEFAYIIGGLIAYRKIGNLNWIQYSFLCWIVVCPFINVLSFIWAGLRIQDGFTGLAYFMISLISWGFTIIPLSVGMWLYVKHYNIKAQ